MKISQFCLFVLFTFLVFGCADAPGKKNGPVTLKVGDITATFIDNSAFGEQHRAGYNGIAELRHSAQESTLFVPLYAGFNIEHIFGGDSLIELFEPRRHPVELERLSDTQVQLHQPETPLSHVESWTTFTLTPPHYIDVDFRCIFHSTEFFKHGYAGIFWASYINAPPDRKIYFLGHKKEHHEREWITAWSPEHGLNSTHRSENDAFHMFVAPNFNVVLAKGMSDYRWREPFYYGRFHNMVFAYMFAVPPNEIIRFSQSPTGGGEKNPAWDFHLLIPDVMINKPYTFSARLVYKEFISAEDIAAEYHAWNADIKD